MSDEVTNEEMPETPETEPDVIDSDPKVMVGGEEYSVTELADAKKNYDDLRDYAENLEEFKSATHRLMDPNTDSEVKKRDARDILLSANYTPEQVNEWVKIYDQTEEPMANTNETPNPQPDTSQMAQQNAQQNERMNDELMKMRARMLQENLENKLSGAISSSKDGKVLADWLNSNRQGDELEAANNSLSERVRVQALENLRQRRNYAGTFDESWVGEEVSKAADKVAADMLTVIGDPSKIGRVSETGEQADNLYRKEPVPLPTIKGKKYGDIEGDLNKWTTDQLMRSLSESGEDSKL